MSSHTHKQKAGIPCLRSSRPFTMKRSQRGNPDNNTGLIITHNLLRYFPCVIVSQDTIRTWKHVPCGNTFPWIWNTNSFVSITNLKSADTQRHECFPNVFLESVWLWMRDALHSYSLETEPPDTNTPLSTCSEYTHRIWQAASPTFSDKQAADGITDWLIFGDDVCSHAQTCGNAGLCMCSNTTAGTRNTFPSPVLTPIHTAYSTKREAMKDWNRIHKYESCPTSLFNSLCFSLPVYLDQISRRLLNERNSLLLHHCDCPAQHSLCPCITVFNRMLQTCTWRLLKRDKSPIWGQMSKFIFNCTLKL